eukprot:s3613_g2.t1
MSGQAGRPQIDLAKVKRVPEDDEGLSPQKAQDQALQTVVSRFETMLTEKVGKTDSRVDDLEKKLESMEAKLQQAIEGDTSAPAQREDEAGDLHRRQRTLVYGGWARDTRRMELLAELRTALESLSVAHLVEERGGVLHLARSSSAGGRPMVICELVCKGLSGPSPTPKLWANKGASCGAIGASPRVVGSLDQSKLAQLEVEWNQGSVWTYSNLVASSAVPVPPGSKVQDLFVREELDNKPWVDVAKLSGDLKLDARRVRSAVAEVN